jgi:hypothetical protein
MVVLCNFWSILRVTGKHLKQLGCPKGSLVCCQQRGYLTDSYLLIAVRHRGGICQTATLDNYNHLQIALKE